MGVGLGKTHFRAIGNQVLETIHQNVILVTSEKFTLTLLSRKNNKMNLPDFIDLPIFLIDDVHFLEVRNKRKFFHTFNELYQWRIVIISDVHL